MDLQVSSWQDVCHHGDLLKLKMSNIEKYKAMRGDINDFDVALTAIKITNLLNAQKESKDFQVASATKWKEKYTLQM